jgi:hypothetical protein
MIGHFIHGHGPERGLVLHGWFGDWRVFEPLLPALDESRFSFAFMDYHLSANVPELRVRRT